MLQDSLQREGDEDNDNVNNKEERFGSYETELLLRSIKILSIASFIVQHLLGEVDFLYRIFSKRYCYYML